MDIHTFTDIEFTEHANKAKESLIVALCNDEVLTKEQGEKILSTYSIVVTKKGWLGSWIDKARGIPDEGFYFTCVKMVYPSLKEDDES